MSNLGLWSSNYTGKEPFCYGSGLTYNLGASFLADCPTVEDWGCGAQWFREIVKQRDLPVQVTGVDGSSGLCDIVAELTTHRPTPRPAGIFMRHVLEHNRNWREILQNALQSFEQKMFLILFTPTTPTEEILYEFNFQTGGSCPVLSLPIVEIKRIIYAAGISVCDVYKVTSPGVEFNEETVLKLQRNA